MNGVVDETVDELWLFEELFGDKALVPFGDPDLFFVLVGSPSAKGSFIYYVITFLYKPQHFHEFFEHFFLFVLKIS